MGAELVEERDVLARDVRQVLEQPGNDPVVRSGSRDVGERDANLVTRLDDLFERLCADGAFERVDERGAFVLQARNVRWRNDNRAVFGKIHGQMALAVSKVNFHSSDTEQTQSLLTCSGNSARMPSRKGFS